ncbi:MAG: hypothetical protein G01um10147_252 [Microgenomates group bacterium Gr01-1014_7]|nr:MAG: hypothetical protein G01um10147_252 [Microgenomates group bacterium Gr01-1014_7]
MKAQSQTFNVALPEDLVKKADKVAKKEYRNRSELIREALRNYLQESVSKTIGMFLPRRTEIFSALIDQSLILKEAAKVFKEAVSDWKKLDASCFRLKQLEHEADNIVHTLTNEIEKTFMLSLDKEDIKDLAESVDDVMDEIEQVANRLKIYKVPKGNIQIKEFANLIVKMIDQLNEGMRLLKRNKLSSREFATCCLAIHEIESAGDDLHRQVLSEMIGKRSLNKDILSMIIWKEIFQSLEDTLDKCEDIAIIFDRLKLKYR